MDCDTLRAQLATAQAATAGLVANAAAAQALFTATMALAVTRSSLAQNASAAVDANTQEIQQLQQMLTMMGC